MFNHSGLGNKKILITGGAGFIGHNLSLQLRGLGCEVHVIDGLQVNNLGYYSSIEFENQNSERYIEFVNERLRLMRAKKVKLHIIDARDYHLVSKVISDIEPDVVVHAAAVSHANRSNKDPFSTFDHSMRTLENVLDCSRLYKSHLIFFSSSMVYGDFDNDVVGEDRECNPMGIYGALKLGAEKLVIAYGQVFDLPYTIIRPSALYGERCVSRRVGQAFIENALMGKDLTINGDGEDALDFTYIEDFVQGVTKCIGNEKAIGEIFNITFGGSRKLNDLAALVSNEFPGINVIHRERDSLMPERGTLDISKAQELLGFQPLNPIEVGFQRYMQWYRKFEAAHPKLFHNNI